ncbi:hypothetical protein DFP73DRAFT_532340 [Morchella snyderi]|nr:hypothetical protein DFP73DRAFT_532340 [Morchella snyderi]
MEGKRSRGWLPAFEPAKTRRRRFENAGSSEPLLRESSVLDNAESSSVVWDDPTEEDAQQLQQLEAVIEEDLEPALQDNTGVIQPINTNLMGVEWGGNEESDAYDDVLGRREVQHGVETVGGDLLDDDDVEVTGVEKAGDIDRDNHTIFFPPDAVQDDDHTTPDAVQDDDHTTPDAVQDDLHATPDAVQDAVPGAFKENVMDGSNVEYFDKCGEEFHLAMMLFVTSADLSTTQYEALTEVLALASMDTLKSLPKSVKTLQQRCRRAFPLMSVKGKLVDVDLRQIPPKKETPRNAYYFDPSEYCKIWLSSPTISRSLHQGLGEYVDVASELWHGDAWMESVRSTSRLFPFIHDNRTGSHTPLFPSDCVKYINSNGEVALGRVKCIGIDKRQGRTQTQQASALINPLVPPHELLGEWAPPDDSVDPFPQYDWVESNLPELILVESKRDIIPCSDIQSRVWVYFTDYPTIEELSQSLLPESPTFCVRLIAYRCNHEHHIRTVHKRHRVLAETELIKLTRAYVLENMISTSTANTPRRISVPYSVFLDGFGLYRNAYYSLKGMYMTPAGMNIHDRARLNNMVVLMIGPFGSHEQQMAACLEIDAIAIGRGIKLTLDSGEDVFVVAFPLLLTGDMPQQNQNSGAKIHKATYGCRSCFVSEADRGILTFNIQHHGRYQQHVKMMYDNAIALSTKSRRDTALRRAGLSETGPFFEKCFTMMDPQRGTPNDPMHAELRLCKYFEEALLEGILSADGIKAYLAAWNVVQVPYGWGQPQNPVSHKGSMVFNEHGRIAIVNPFVLMHMFTNDSWSYHPDEARGSRTLLQHTRRSYVKPLVARNLSVEFGAGEEYTGGIVKTAWLLARCVTLALQETISTRERCKFNSTVVQARYNLQKVFKCASGDRKTFKNYASVPNIHLALHYQEDIQNYATARNSSTMSGEQKHKIFKLNAPHTNSKDNDLQLMKATNTAQTITFLLARAFEVSAPEITAQLDRVVQKCPIMCSRFLGVIKEPHETDDGPDQVISGSGIDCEKSLFKRANTGIAVPVKKIAPTDYEYDGETRCKVYEVEYEAELLPHVRIKIHYWRYFSGVPDQGRKARPFKIRENQIIRLRDEPYSFHRRRCRRWLQRIRYFVYVQKQRK